MLGFSSSKTSKLFNTRLLFVVGNLVSFYHVHLLVIDLPLVRDPIGTLPLGGKINSCMYTTTKLGSWFKASRDIGVLYLPSRSVSFVVWDKLMY